MHPDELAVRALHDTWIAAVNAGDLAKLLTLFTEDVVFVNTGQAPFGREGFEAGFTNGHRQFALKCTSEPLEVVIAGDLAHTLAKDSLSLVARSDGEKIEFAGYRLTIYRKQADGRWLLSRDLHNLSRVDG